MRKIFIVWNPASGGKSAKLIKRLSGMLESQGLNYQVEDTRISRNATITVREKLDHSFTDLIIVGGDGTINEAINGLAFDIPVGILPAGTGDDFVKMLAIGKSAEEHIHVAMEGTISAIDLGICNGRKFINGIGIGFDGQIVEDMASKRIPLLTGHAAYYYHVLRILGGYREKDFDFQLDAQPFTKELILLTIGNGSTFGGGFKLMPNARLDDGLLEVCEIGRLSGIKRFLNIHKLSNGAHGSMSMVHFHQAKHILVKANPLLYGHIDGERLGNPPFDIQVLPRALRLRTMPT